MTVERKRILLVTRNLPPLVGGMERLNWHMADELAKVAEVRVISPQGSAAMAPPNVAVTEVPLRPLWKFLGMAQWHALAQARRWRPQVVLAGSGLTAPAAWLAARMAGAKAAVYVHGLDLAVGHPLYKAIWRPVLRRMDRVIANSTPTRQLAEAIGIRPERIGIVHPGVELPAEVAEAALKTAPTRQATGNCTPVMPPANPFRQQHNLGDRPLLLSVGRLSIRKGLREFVAQALPRVVAVQPDALLLIVGDEPSQALHARAQTRESIQAVAEQRGVGANLRFLGLITDFAELGEIYRAADVHVFPVREIPGDPEGFGMVAVEAAAHGLPTVAFASGGVIDAVADGKSGRLVAPSDYKAFADGVLQTLTERSQLRAPCVRFAEQFAWPAFGEAITIQLDGAMA